MQLNVSYNFKRLAQKNDIQIRNYMIENGISLSKDDDGMETALEIHQIQHNVIRTNRYRTIVAPEIRRNSTTSSVSGTSTMIVQSDANNSNSVNNFVTPRPMVRPIQIKTEPVDDDEAKEASPVTTTSSPSNASEPASIVTVHSSVAPSEKRPPPMIVINGIINNDSFPKTPEVTAVKAGRSRKESTKAAEKQKETSHNLRTIKKKTEVQNNKKLRKTLKKVAAAAAQRASPRKKEIKVKPRTAKFKIVSKNRGPETAKTQNVQKKPRGRPPKSAATNNTKTKNKTQKGKGKSWEILYGTRFQDFVNSRTRFRKLAMIHRRYINKW